MKRSDHDIDTQDKNLRPSKRYCSRRSWLARKQLNEGANKQEDNRGDLKPKAKRKRTYDHNGEDEDENNQEGGIHQPTRPHHCSSPLFLIGEHVQEASFELGVAQVALTEDPFAQARALFENRYSDVVFALGVTRVCDDVEEDPFVQARAVLQIQGVPVAPQNQPIQAPPRAAPHNDLAVAPHNATNDRQMYMCNGRPVEGFALTEPVITGEFDFTGLF